MKKKNFSLRTKVLLSTSLLIILGGALATYTIFSYTKNILISKERDLFEKTSRERVIETKNVLDFSQESVKFVSENELVGNFLYQLESEEEVGEELLVQQREEIEKRLTRRTKDSFFDILYILDRDGSTVVSTEERLLDKNYSFRDYFKGAMNEGSFIDFSVGVTTGKPGYYFSKAVQKDGEVVGVVVGKMNTKDIDRSIDNDFILEDAEIMLVDRFGVIIHSKQKDRLYKALGEMSDNNKEIISKTERYSLDEEIEVLGYDFAMEEIEKEKDFLMHEFMDELHEEEEIVSLVKVGEYPFYIFSEIELDDVVGPAVDVAMILAFTTGAISLVVIFFVSYLLYMFLSPIGELKKIAEKMGNNDFSGKIDIKTGDELGDLADSLNKTSKKLKNVYGSIEKKVEKRTEELEKLNKFMVGRELKMLELKRQIAKLKKENKNTTKKK